MPEPFRKTVARRYAMLGTPHPALTESAFPALTAEPTSRMLALQFQLERSEWWQPDRVAAEQKAQLALVVKHAYETTPYYRTIFAREGIRLPLDINGEFLGLLPISRREDIQAAGPDMVSRRHPKEHGKPTVARTSGSTGRPVEFGRDNLTNLMGMAFSLRDHLWHGRDFSGKIAFIRQVERGRADAPLGARTTKWEPSVASFFPTGPSVVLDIASSLKDQVAWLRREQPDQLVSLPSHLVTLASYAKATGEPLQPIGEIRTFGETLPAESREVIQGAWGGKVTDIYACEEAGYLALQCPEYDHFHIMSESVLVEIVDEAGHRCEAGAPGRVVVTSLHNFATPLIRYDIGDYAESGPPCPCGRGLPMLRRVLGRRRNRLLLPSGSIGFPRLDEKTFAAVPGLRVDQFRCIQKSLGAVELQLVCSPIPDPAQQAKIAEIIAESLGHAFAVNFTFPRLIPPGPRGRVETFVSEI
jgi:phenylacetate-CoA ligase